MSDIHITQLECFLALAQAERAQFLLDSVKGAFESMFTDSELSSDFDHIYVHYYVRKLTSINEHVTELLQEDLSDKLGMILEILKSASGSLAVHPCWTSGLDGPQTERIHYAGKHIKRHLYSDKPNENFYWECNTLKMISYVLTLKPTCFSVHCPSEYPMVNKLHAVEQKKSYVRYDGWW